MKLIGKLLPVSEVTPTLRSQMFVLMDQHYENITQPTFEADLEEKQWVIAVFEPRTGALCGFSTQMLLDVEVAGQPIRALFSGDTIMARDHWGDSALAHVWGRLALSLIDTSSSAELYWFLISKGYKTYRFLPVFFREFYPSPECSTPNWARDALVALARAKFADAFDPCAGVVRAWPSKDRLRQGVADVSPQRLRDPHVRFFVDHNPGHARGDELCCLAPLTRSNFTPAAYRVIGPEPVVSSC